MLKGYYRVFLESQVISVKLKDAFLSSSTVVLKPKSPANFCYTLIRQSVIDTRTHACTCDRQLEPLINLVCGVFQ